MVTHSECPSREHPLGHSAHSPSAQHLPGWTLQSEVLMREVGTWLLTCTCMCAWAGLGVSVPGDGGGEGWHCVCRGGCGGRAGGRGAPVRLHGEGLGLGCAGTRLPEISRGFSPTQVARSEPIPSGSPSLARGNFSWARSLGPALSEGSAATPSPSPSPALKQPLWACKGHCSQGLGLSRATPTTSSGLTATGLPQSWARGPAPGCSSPGEAGGQGVEGRGGGRETGWCSGPLVPTHALSSNHAPGSKHRCVFRASVCTVELPPEEVLVPSDNFTITFHRHVSGKEQVSLVDPQYLPRRHGEAWVSALAGSILATSPATVPADGTRASIRRGPGEGEGFGGG